MEPLIQNETIVMQGDKKSDQIVSDPEKIISELTDPKTDDSSSKRSRKDSEKGPQKKKRKVNHGRMIEGSTYICFENLPFNFIKEIKESLDKQFSEVPEAKDSKCQIYNGNCVLIKPTPEEIKAERQKYRKEYRRRPNVIQKRHEKSKDPKVIAKRKEYSSRPEVKKRKKLLSKRRRRALKALKEGNPEIYHKVMSEEPLTTPNYGGNPDWVPSECWDLSEKKSEESETDDDESSSETESN